MPHLSSRIIFLFAVIIAGGWRAGDACGDTPPKDRVVALYFHRTERCPTCQKMGSYSEEAIKQAFGAQINRGSVEFHFVDFQDAKNVRLAKGYKITGPALIIARIQDNHVKEYRNLQEIWARVGDPPAFFEYVQKNLTALLTLSSAGGA